VTVLVVVWRGAPASRCTAIRTGRVWVPAAALDRDFPPASPSAQ
jgi:hypothetical protein